MRVCMFIWNFWPGPQGGAERQCWKQARELVRQGQECTVLTKWTKWQSPRMEECNGVSIRRAGSFGPVTYGMHGLRLFIKSRISRAQAEQAVSTSVREDYSKSVSPTCGMLSPFRFVEYLFFMAESYFYFLLHRRSIDVIHVHGACWMPGFAITFSRRWGIPVISKETIMPVFPEFAADLPFHRTWNRLRRRADAYIAIHEDIRDALAKETPPGTAIHVLPNGVEIPEKIASLDNQHVLIVANLAQGAAHKAFDILLEAWRLVAESHPHAQLDVVGRGDDAHWKAYANKLGCAKSIVFHGSTTEIDRYYERASVFVLPSRKEGLSNALLEAQSWGVPAVVSDIPGNRKVVRDGETGFIVPVGNIESLAGSISRLLLDDELRHTMGKNARTRIEKVFSITAVCSNLREIYANMLNADHPETNGAIY